jgi:hypothetical protein
MAQGVKTVQQARDYLYECCGDTHPGIKMPIGKDREKPANERMDGWPWCWWLGPVISSKSFSKSIIKTQKPKHCA